MKKIIFSILISSLISGFAYAGDDDNNCGKLSVVVTNTTDSTCTLIKSNLRHGYFKYTSSIPMYIPRYTSTTPIYLEQSIFGPELELSYSCGENTILTFTSKQNLCFLSAGDVTGRVLMATNGSSADYQAINGSWFWSQHGSINWRLQ